MRLGFPPEHGPSCLGLCFLPRPVGVNGPSQEQGAEGSSVPVPSATPSPCIPCRQRAPELALQLRGHQLSPHIHTDPANTEQGLGHRSRVCTARVATRHNTPGASMTLGSLLLPVLERGLGKEGLALRRGLPPLKPAARLSHTARGHPSTETLKAMGALFQVLGTQLRECLSRSFSVPLPDTASLPPAPGSIHREGTPKTAASAGEK